MLSTRKYKLTTCLAVLLLLTGCANPQESVARKFWNALASGDLAIARELVSADSSAVLHAARDQATQIRLTGASELVDRGNAAEFEGRFRLVDAPEGAELDAVISLVEEDGEWKVRFPGDLLPGLVARAFWASVAQGDQAAALRYTSAGSNLALEQSWEALQTLTIQGYGATVSDQESASVAMTYRAKQVGEQDLQSSTSLVREEGLWVVSAPGTVARIFGNAMGEMAREAAEAMRESMEEAGKAMQESMQEAGKLLQENLEQAGKAMKEGLEALKREMEKLEEGAPEDKDQGI